MGRSGLLGTATLLLLALAALVALARSGPGRGLWGGAPADSAGAGLHPAVRPYRGVAPRASVDQADRMIDDIEAMGRAYP